MVNVMDQPTNPQPNIPYTPIVDPPSNSENPYPHAQYPEQRYYQTYIKKEVSYSKTDGLFALIGLLLGYLFIRFVLMGTLGISVAIYGLLFCLLSVMFMKSRRISMTASGWVWLMILVIFSLNFAISSNITVKICNVFFIIGAVTFWIYAACAGNGVGAIRRFAAADFVKALIIMPFSSFGACIGALFSSTKKSRFSNQAKWISIGLVITVPFTFIIAALLFQADSAFQNLFLFLFDDVIERFGRFTLQFCFGIPVAFYLFGLWFSNGNHENEHVLTDDGCNEFLKNMKFAPRAVLYTALTPICLLYCLFFVSQSAYFLSAFQNFLPAGYSYANYARQGFFELCAVSVINLLILWSIQIVCKADDERKPIGLKIYSVMLTVFTLMLIATAMRKMILYIDNYGLTPLRVYTTWFMVLLSVVFLLCLIRQFYTKMPVARCTVIAFVLLFALLNFVNVDGMIAKYNVECYQSGKLEEIDMDMMANLSDAAVPYVLPLTKSNDKVVANEAREYIASKKTALEQQSFLDWNWSSYMAKQCMANAN